MTDIIKTKITCNKCLNIFEIEYEASINTWLNPELIEKILKKLYNYSCTKCGNRMFLQTYILINCPKGMFFINTGDDLSNIINRLLMYEIIDKDGNIL